MGTDDREKLELEAIDRMLRRSVRREIPPQGQECPDADHLAAYREQALSQAETDQLEAHLATCRRCQDALVALAVSEPELTELVAEERGVDEFAVAAAVVQAPVRAPAQAVRVRERRIGPSEKFSMPWRWLAPAAALAGVAVLTLLVGRPSNQLPRIVSRPGGSDVSSGAAGESQVQTQIAKNLAAPPPSAPRGAEAALKTAPASGAQGTMGSAKAKSTPALVGGVPSSSFPRGTGSGAELFRAGAPAEKVVAEDQTSGTKKTEVAGQPPVPSTPPPPATSSVVVEGAAQGVAGSIPSGTPLQMSQTATRGQALKRDRGGKEPEAGAEEMSAVQKEFRGTSKDGVNLLVPVVAESDSVIRWRVGSAGRIERSTDAGKNWQEQISGVKTLLASGSAPSPKVCWIVGASGTILRTTDGEHWEKIPSPAPLNWIHVSAVDAQQAVITSADGKRYATSDGGQHWEPR